jgi:hypothetical protein
MPQNGFYLFLQSIIGFFQWIFLGFTRLLAPLFAISPLPDSIDLILVCIIIIALIFALFQSAPWNK